MNYIKKILFLFFFILFAGCANYKTEQSKERKFYTSNGFALIYDNQLFEIGGISKRFSNNKIIDNKINYENIVVMHSQLKKNTPISIINPENSLSIETKISKRADYPKIFNIVVSKKIATILELDEDNPYVEIFEIKKNKTFIAKESNIFEEEKKVAEEAPVDEVKMTNLSKNEIEDNKNIVEKNFILVVSDFYYFESAENLRSELVEKVQKNNFSVRKINDNKYRLFAGPFKDFNSLKFIYISLNNLGFENLNIHRE